VGDEMCMKDNIKMCSQEIGCGVDLITPKSSVFWDITPFNPLKVNQFSEEYFASIFKVKE
jgi:hypothetical protein